MVAEKSHSSSTAVNSVAEAVSFGNNGQRKKFHSAKWNTEEPNYARNTAMSSEKRDAKSNETLSGKGKAGRQSIEKSTDMTGTRKGSSQYQHDIRSGQDSNIESKSGKHRTSHFKRRKIVSGPVSVLINGDEVERRAFLDKLRSEEEKLTISEFNEVVSTLSRERRLREALALIQIHERKSLSSLITSSQSVKTYTIMIDVYGKAYQLARAFSLFYGMTRSGVQPNVITYNAMVAACSRSNEPDLAYEVFEEMQANGLKPDKFTYGSLIDSCAKCGQVERAFEISRLMDRNGVAKDQTIYSALMDACGRAQQLERAFLVFEEMKRNSVWPNLITFSVLIDTCANARQPERAFHLFSEVKHWGYATPNVVVYTSLIDACSKAGWPERAELVMKNMIDRGIQPNQITFGALLEGWAREGHLDRAFNVLERMATDHNVLPNAVLLGGLVDACRRLKGFSRMKEIWSVMVKYNLRPSRSYYPAMIVMATVEEDFEIASAIVLHGYARGYLRRVQINSENPALHALACALVFLKYVLMEDTCDREKRNECLKRLKVAFNSTGISPAQMKAISAEEARDFCLSWGDVEPRDMGFPGQHRSFQRDKHGIYSKNSAQSKAAKKAKDAAFNKMRNS